MCEKSLVDTRWQAGLLTAGRSFLESMFLSMQEGALSSRSALPYLKGNGKWNQIGCYGELDHFTFTPVLISPYNRGHKPSALQLV